MSQTQDPHGSSIGVFGQLLNSKPMPEFMRAFQSCLLDFSSSIMEKFRCGGTERPAPSPDRI